jgi:hypothetical protein
MRIGFVGTVTVFRFIDIKGLKVGQIDVVQYGDNKYPTKIHTINVLDQSYCKLLIEVLETTPLPLIRAICWLEISKYDLQLELIQLVSVNESLLPNGSGVNENEY